MAKKVKVQYFASFREKSGLSFEQIETESQTLAEIYGELARRHGFLVPVQYVRFAIGDQLANRDLPISDGMEMLLMPPFAGG